MSIDPYLRELKLKHSRLSKAVAKLERKPGADLFEVRGMKKEKLRLKEEIARQESKTRKQLDTGCAIAAE